jgi:flagellar basal body-associated protein FliL
MIIIIIVIIIIMFSLVYHFSNSTTEPENATPLTPVPAIGNQPHISWM